MANAPAKLSAVELKALPAQEPRRLITFTRLDRIERKPLDPVIDGYLYADTLASVVGKSGSCKSFFVQGMCASIATGIPWMGRRVQQGAVFYLGGEGLAGIRKRFDGWSTYTGISLAEAPLFIASSLPPLHDEMNAAAAIAEIQTIADDLFFHSGGIEPRLVVVDTLARAMAGCDENSAADMSRLIGCLDWIRQQWHCCVLMIHHTGHGENTRERGRGSSAYYAALDSELLVTSDGLRVQARSTKEKDWGRPAELVLDRHLVEVPVGDALETTLALDAVPDLDERARASALRHEIQRLKAAGLPIRAIAAELGITKSKVEHELAVVGRQSDSYRRHSDGE